MGKIHIENGVADLSDPLLKDRVTELKAIRDQGRADAEGAEDAIERLGPSITPQALKTFARQARRRTHTESGGYRRDHLRALAQRVEVDAKEVRIMGSKSVLLRTLVAASSAKTAGFGVPSFVPAGRWSGPRSSSFFVPIFLPLLDDFGINPLFFGVMVALNLQTSFLSPPVATAPFYLKGVVPAQVTINEIFRGVMPYIWIVVGFMILMYLFPGMALWLPSVMYR